jgi:hypothetical protein
MWTIVDHSASLPFSHGTYLCDILFLYIVYHQAWWLPQHKSRYNMIQSLSPKPQTSLNYLLSSTCTCRPQIWVWLPLPNSSLVCQHAGQMGIALHPALLVKERWWNWLGKPRTSRIPTGNGTPHIQKHEGSVSWVSMNLSEKSSKMFYANISYVYIIYI